MPDPTDTIVDPLEREYDHAVAVLDAARTRAVELLLIRIGRLTAEHYPTAAELIVFGSYDIEALLVRAARVLDVDGQVLDGYGSDSESSSEAWDAFTDLIDTDMLDTLAGLTGDEYSGRHSLDVPGDALSPTETCAEALGVAVNITTSAGSDGAVLVILDTDFEPDGSDGGPGLRVMVNDGDGFVGVAFAPPADDQ
jgi:hypothetical protein